MRPASSHSRLVNILSKDSLGSYLKFRLLHLQAGLQSHAPLGIALEDGEKDYITHSDGKNDSDIGNFAMIHIAT